MVTKTQAIHDARPEIFDDHIHPVEQLQAKIDTFGSLQIDRDTLFTSIEPQKKGSLSAREWWTPAPAQFAPLRRFQFVDVRSVFREQQRAIRPGQGMREIHHSQPLQRAFLRSCW